ncbi:MAG: hypothetical protein UU65_C0002G0132 [candidate division CPR2 bacterium GW2011_GWC1_41_48]|uniref:Uncharacterized protein n=1 Tax=candidate division CPR2 bacterium GW2011_GWC1_41_48 TaxID=1618344 RepID=A0A0G0W8N2_UNCC2|nr:MAG: hypothetical protein UT47_C0002G0172 [candidate division CPR2 bacterium GW2011_GWC2_39_35]KKR28310.1 MAG: hypothetical protein UT60_C0023G0018 [candidate division CPR2 bacterium GW2011_GWD2_39_7]KKS09354.1 MAG: hypothetical protein UU65_C0002G0132 [candidate division CPR2 bacterium GW2011_GWC1_41_48]
MKVLSQPVEKKDNRLMIKIVAGIIIVLILTTSFFT